jgi:PAS domain S-box-containing protein
LLDLLATTTSRFIIEPASGIADASQGMLRDIGELFGVDRAYLFQILPDGVTMSNTVEWCAEGIHPAIDDLQDLPVDLFPWWIDRMRRDLPIRLLSLDDLPSEASAEREILEPQGIQSLLVLPVTYRGNVAGFVGFDHVRSQRAWTDDEVSILRFIGSALAHALERQRLDEHLERAATVFGSSREALLVTDADRLIVEVNPAFTAITGFRPDDVLGRNPVDVLAGDATDVDAAAALREAWQAGAPIDVEVRVVARDGTPVWLEVRGNPLRTRTGGAGGYMAIASNISERKATDQMKSEFLSTVSHELRTPLTAIAGALGLMRGGAVGAFDEGTQRFLDIADRNLRRLTGLVDDLLDVERLSHSGMPMPLSDHDVDALVEDAVTSNQIIARRYDVTLRVTQRLEGVLVHVNALRLQQVLTNLLSNAAKFSPPGSTVDLAVTRSGDGVDIAVIDHGPGIPPEFHDRVFDRFAMADGSDSRQQGGTGLGLSIAHSLTERMGGTLTFQTSPGQGTTFTVHLPAA